MGRFANELRIDPENWRAGLLTLILRLTALMGSLTYVPSVYAALGTGRTGIALIDTVAIAAILGLCRFDRLPFRWRALGLVSTLYFLAVGLLIGVGSVSQIYLFGFSVLTAILLGVRAGFVSALLSAATMLVVGALGFAPLEMAFSGMHFSRFEWAVITLNFTFVNTTLTLAIGALISTLDSALSRQVASRTSLDRERTLLRTLIDALPDVVFTKDTSGRFVSSNPATLALVGFDREEQLAGKTVFDLYPPDIAEQLHADDVQVLSGRPLMDREERIVDAKGMSIWRWTIKVPLRTAAGEVVGLIGISRDISDRKRTEAERDRVLAQLRIQIERLPLAFFLTGGDFRITRWNPAAERMFGFTEAETLGKHPFEIMVPPESQPLLASLFDQIKAGDMDAHREIENRTKDGRTIACEWHNTPLFELDGIFAGLLSVVQDLTARKLLEKQFRQSQKMEAFGQLAGGVAHDFNNLLTIINGYSDLLLESLPPGDPSRKLLAPIQQAGERSAGLTRQLLAFSRQQVLAPRVINVNEVVIETDKMLRRLIGEDVRLSMTLDSDPWAVLADPGQIEQVLLNLAVNARTRCPREVA